MAEDHLTYNHPSVNQLISAVGSPNRKKSNLHSAEEAANSRTLKSQFISTGIYGMEALTSSDHTFRKESTTTLNTNDAQERQRLETYVYKLKMKVHTLKERVQSHQEKDTNNRLAIQDLTSRLSMLEKEVQDKSLTIEEKDLILRKVLAQYEGLKTILLQHKGEIQQQLDFQEKMNLSRKVNRNSAHAAQYQKIDYEQALLMTYIEHLTMKQEEIALIENQMREYELLLKGRSKDRSLTLIHKEKDKLESSWSFAQEKITILEEELSQYRSQLEVFQTRISKEKNTKHELQTQLKEILSKRSALEEEHRQQVYEVQQKYTLQLESLQAQFQSELEQQQRDHLLSLKEHQEKSQQEILTLQRLHEKEIESLRSNETAEKQRQREDLLSRVTEKTEEVQLLRQQLDSQQQKAERWFQENESHKAELKQHQLLLQQHRSELDKRQEEIQSLLPLKATVQQLQQKLLESQEIVKKESIEKLQITFQRDQTAQQLADLTKTHKELEQECQALKIETHRLTFATSDLSKQTEAVSSFQREIETYREKVQKLSNEILEGQYKYQHLLKEQEGLQQEYQRVLGQLRKEQERCQHLAQQLESCQTALTSEKQQLGVEREERKKVETVLQELRGVVSTLQVQAEAKENQFVQAEAERLGETEEWQRQVSEWTAIYRMVMQAMEDWESLMSSIVDGQVDQTSSISGNKNHTRFISSRGSVSTTDLATSLASLLESPRGGGSSTKKSSGLTLADLSDVKAGGSSTSSSSMHRIRSSMTRRTKPTTTSKSPAPSLQRGKVSSYETNHDDGRFTRGSSRLSEARQEIAVRIERLTHRFEKIESTRQYYHHERESFFETVEQLTLSMQSQLRLAEERIQRLVSQVQVCQETMEQDQVSLQQERQDFQTIKEVLIREQREAYQQLETKYSELVMRYQELTAKDTEQQQQLLEVLEEKRSLQFALQTNSLERDQLLQLEATIHQLHSKYDTMQQQYQAVETDKLRLEARVQQLLSDQQLVLQERLTAQTELERVLQQNQVLTETVEEFERRYRLACQEIERLENRPLEADLALRLLEMQRREGGFESSKAGVERPVVSTVLSAFSSPAGRTVAVGADTSQTLTSSMTMYDRIERLSPLRSSRRGDQTTTSFSFTTGTSSNTNTAVKTPKSVSKRSFRERSPPLFIDTTASTIGLEYEDDQRAAQTIEKLDQSLQLLSSKFNSAV